MVSQRNVSQDLVRLYRLTTPLAISGIIYIMLPFTRIILVQYGPWKVKQNYDWHYGHFVSMAREFEYRRNKKHVTFEKLGKILAAPPENISAYWAD